MTRISSKNDIRWNFDLWKWEGITAEQALLWEKLYPDVNVVQVLKVDMPRWFDLQVKGGKVNKIARKKDLKRFIHNWLKREQIKAVL